MIPVLLGSSWKFFPSLDQKDTGVTDVSTSDLTQTAETEESHEISFKERQAS